MGAHGETLACGWREKGLVCSGMSRQPDNPRQFGERASAWVGRWALVPVSLLIAIGLFVLRPSTEVEVETFVLHEFGHDAPVAGPGGHAFFAAIVLERAGYPVLIRLDDRGWPSRLFPYDGLVGFPADQELRLPDPDHGVTWSSPEPPVPQRYLVAVTRDRDLDLDEVMRRAEREAWRSPTLEEARSRVVEILEERVGPVRTARMGPART